MRRRARALALASLALLGAALWWRAQLRVQGAAGGVADMIERAMSAITPGPWEPPARAAPYLAAIRESEARYSLPHNLLARVIYQESRFLPEIIDGRVRSSAGAIGIAQFMPATARDLGVDPLDAFASIDAAARYLAQLHRAAGSWQGALAAYNWGIGNLQRRGIDAAPEETRRYVAEIGGDVGIA